MGKQSKKSKKSSKNELDIILAQLKKTYIDDNASEFEEDDTNSSMSEEDYELNKLLEELFASPEDEKNVQNKSDDSETTANTVLSCEPITQDPEKEESFEEVAEIEEAIDGSILPDAEEIPDADNFEDAQEIQANDEISQSPSLLDKITDDNDSVQDVEDILHLMFASNSSESNHADISPSDADTETVEELDADEVSDSKTILNEDESEDEKIDVPWEDSSDNESISVIPDGLNIPLSSIEDSLTDEEDADDEFLDEDESIDFVDAVADDEWAEPAVTDEEYDISANDEIPDDDSDLLIEIPRPIMVTDPSEYKSDPLQKRLPDLTARTQAAVDSIKRDDIHTFITQSQNKKDSSTDLDSNDISLLLKFGYDEEVKAKIGEEKAQEILIDKDKEFVPEDHKIPYGFCGKELTDRSQIKEIKQKYKTDRRALVFSAILIAVISAALIFLDLIFDISPNRTSYPFVLVIDILLVALMALLLRKKLTAGVIDVIRFEATPYSILAFLMLAFVLCNLANGLLYLINAKTLNSSDLVLFGACMAFCTASILVSDVLNCQREINTFEIISSSDTLYTAEKHKNPSEIPTPEKRGENQHASSRFTDSKSYKVRKTSLVSGYFRRMSHGDSKNVNIIYVLGIVPILSLIIGCVCAIVSGNIMKGISSMMITTFLCTPLSYILLPTVTEFIASVILKKKNSSFIGAEAVSDYAHTDCLFFNDTDAIEVLSYTEIHPSKSSDEQENLEIAYRVFGALGGPLGEFAKKQGQISNSGNNAEVVINSISENGIEIYFDSSINILIGDRQFMSSNNIRVKTDSNLNNAIKGYDRSVIYMAFDGIPKLGFIVTSKIRSDFASTVATLDSNGIKVFVDTYEPQINDLYFEQNKTSISTAVNVCKTEEYESSTQRFLCDGAIVCTSNSLDIAEAIVFSQRIIDQRKKHRRLHFALVSGGFILSCLFALLLNVNGPVLILAGLKIHITVLVSLIMLLMTIPGIISAYKLRKYEFNTKKREDKKK